MFGFKKAQNITNFVIRLLLIGRGTSCCPIRSVIMLVIKQIGLPLRGRPILFITRMIPREAPSREVYNTVAREARVYHTSIAKST